MNIIKQFLGLLAISLLVLIGCRGSSETGKTAGAGDVPDWYNNPPEDPNFIYAVGTATSQDLPMAADKATASARAEIARVAEARVQALQKKFDEEVGLTTDAQLQQMFTQASKTVVSTLLSGSRLKKQEQSKVGDLWRSYVLLDYPIGAANQTLVQQIRNNQQMYTRFRATQTFKELDDEVSKYEAWKKEQLDQQK